VVAVGCACGAGCRRRAGRLYSTSVRERGGRDVAPTVVKVGGLTIAEGTHTATLDGQLRELSRTEFDVLALLASRRGQVVTKRDLLSEVWQQAYGGSERTVDVHLSWLRRKLGESASAPRYLLSVRGVGVRLVDPDSEAS
jgi:DNA-binding response OmpR family regulator